MQFNAEAGGSVSEYDEACGQDFSHIVAERADPRLLPFELMPGQKIVTPLWLYECTVSQRLLPTENEKVTSCDSQCQCFRSRCPYLQNDWRMARAFALCGSCTPQSTSSEMTLCSTLDKCQFWRVAASVGIVLCTQTWYCLLLWPCLTDMRLLRNQSYQNHMTPASSSCSMTRLHLIVNGSADAQVYNGEFTPVSSPGNVHKPY